MTKEAQKWEKSNKKYTSQITLKFKSQGFHTTLNFSTKFYVKLSIFALLKSLTREVFDVKM